MSSFDVACNLSDMFLSGYIYLEISGTYSTERRQGSLKSLICKIYCIDDFKILTIRKTFLTDFYDKSAGSSVEYSTFGTVNFRHV